MPAGMWQTSTQTARFRWTVCRMRSTAFCPRTLRFPAQSRFPRTSMRFNCTKRNTPIICSLPPCGTRSTRGTHIGTIIRWILQNAGRRTVFCRQAGLCIREKSGHTGQSTVRTIFWCEVEPVDDLIRIRVCGDGFLYNMVRAIAGTLTYVGGGKWRPPRCATYCSPATESRPDRPCLPAVCL